MILKEAIAYNINYKSTVILCIDFVDASKPFDEVEYCKLSKLVKEKSTITHHQILVNIITGQTMRVVMEWFLIWNMPC